jgi:RimJ/RimL family protein N-acetyltransferase
MSEDPDEFAAAAGPFLRARPAQNTVALTIIETLRAAGPQVYGAEPPLLGWWHPPAGQVAAACLQTPPFPLLLSSGPAEAMRELARALAGAGRALPGVNASAPVAEQFAAQWRQHTGAAAVIRQRTRLHRLAGLVPPRPAPAGQARVAGPADRDLLVEWFGTFWSESHTLAHPDIGKAVDERVGYGGMTLWEADGVPVSMAGATRQVAGMIRVAPVYTPSGYRRRGYAGAVTAAVTQAALDAGAGEVLLFTDLANPTSNALYQRLGYHPVEDRVIVSFSA